MHPPLPAHKLSYLAYLHNFLNALYCEPGLLTQYHSLVNVVPTHLHHQKRLNQTSIKFGAPQKRNDKSETAADGAAKGEDAEGAATGTTMTYSHVAILHSINVTSLMLLCHGK